MKHPPLSPAHVDAPHQVHAQGALLLESGAAIVDYRQSFVTHGTLDSARANAVLVCASLTGTHHRLDFLIGPGKALDPARWFVVATDPIGNGLSTSPSNSAAQPGARFPDYTLRDMVAAQHRLLTEHLGLTSVHAIAGASMGGMQALQWGVSHPGFMRKLVAMTPMARAPAWSMMVAETARACLMADPAWNGERFDGVPTRGWRAYAGVMGALATRTPAALDFLRSTDAVARWFDALTTQQLASGFDAHDYLYQSRAYAAQDVGDTAGFGGNTAAALAAITAHTLVLAPPLDLTNPQAEARTAAAAIAGARYVEIPSRQGHMAASDLAHADERFLNRVIGEFLAH